MRKIKKFTIWLFWTILIYFFTFKVIIYFDPTNTNIKGLKTLSSFVAILASFFIGSSLVKK